MSTITVPGPGLDATKWAGWESWTVSGSPATIRLVAGTDKRISADLDGLEVGRTYRISLRAMAYTAVTGTKVYATIAGQQRELTNAWRVVEWEVPAVGPVVLEIPGVTSVLVHYMTITTEQAELIAVSDVENGRVTLTITPPGQVLGIVRADDNGTRPVRLPAGTLPAAAPLTVTDFEPALSGQVQYRVKTSLEELTAWTTLARPGLPMAPRFILPHNPLYAVVVETVTDYSAARTTSATVHEIIGRPDPILALGLMRPRAGRLEVFSRTYQDARDLESLFERGQVAMYRQPENPGADMYLVALDLETRQEEQVAWITTINYQEVNAPAGDVLTRMDWTFDALAEAHDTFEDVTRAYANFNQLTISEAGL